VSDLPPLPNKPKYLGALAPGYSTPSRLDRFMQAIEHIEVLVQPKRRRRPAVLIAPETDLGEIVAKRPIQYEDGSTLDERVRE
jgi:hypothetical protein